MTLLTLWVSIQLEFPDWMGGLMEFLVQILLTIRSLFATDNCQYSWYLLASQRLFLWCKRHEVMNLRLEVVMFLILSPHLEKVKVHSRYSANFCRLSNAIKA